MDGWVSSTSRRDSGLCPGTASCVGATRSCRQDSPGAPARLRTRLSSRIVPSSSYGDITGRRLIKRAIPTERSCVSRWPGLCRTLLDQWRVANLCTLSGDAWRQRQPVSFVVTGPRGNYDICTLSMRPRVNSNQHMESGWPGEGFTDL